MHESPPSRPPSAHFTRPPTPIETRLLHFAFTANQKPDRKVASFPCPDMPHIASRLQRTGSCYRRGTEPCAPAAARGQMAAGTRGTRNAKKGEVQELKPAQGLNFCLLSKLKGVKHNRDCGANAFPSSSLPSKATTVLTLHQTTAISPTDISSRPCISLTQDMRRCHCWVPKGAPVLLPPTF